MGNLCSSSGKADEESTSAALKPNARHRPLRSESIVTGDERATAHGTSMLTGDATPSEIKILCWGAGDSGKSTFNRQMRFIYSTHKDKDKTSELEKMKIRQQIHSDMIVGMRALVLLARNDACCSKLDMQLQASSLAAADALDAALPKKTTPAGPLYDLSAELGNCIQELWKDPAIRESWNQRVELWPLLGVANALQEKLYDSLEAYFDSTARIMEDTCAPRPFPFPWHRTVCFAAAVARSLAPHFCNTPPTHPHFCNTPASYVPDQMDMLKCRLMTTGIEETTITVDGTSVRLLDVGGQKSERRKWINFFDNCHVLLFFAPLCDYELQLKEDPSVNRMHDRCAAPAAAEP